MLSKELAKNILDHQFLLNITSNYRYQSGAKCLALG